VCETISKTDTGREVFGRLVVKERGGDLRDAGDGLQRGRALNESCGRRAASRRGLIEPGVEAAIAAELVHRITQILPSESNVDAQTRSDLPVVLKKEREIGDAV